MKRSLHLALVIAVSTTACFLEIVDNKSESDLADEASEELGIDETDETSESTEDIGDSETTCGDGIREASEQCDGEDLNGQSCLDHGFVEGTLACSAACGFDLSGCSPQAVCGNGLVEGAEQCDGEDFSGRDCESFGFSEGELACTPVCEVDSTGCSNG